MQIQNVTLVVAKRLTALALGFAATALVGVGSANAQTLGAASDYNIFVLGDHTATNVDVHGKVAVKGNANYTNYTVGTQENNSTTNVVVGGNYTNSNGTITGSAVAGGDFKHTNPSINGNVSANGKVDFSGGGGQVNGNIKYGTTYTGPNYTINNGYSTTQGTTTLPVNFAQAQADLINKSASFAALTPTTNAAFNGNNISIAAANSGVTVVNLTAEQWQNATSYNYTGGANSTLLINIINPSNLASVTVPNTGTNFTGGLGFANVLYNVSATNLATINLAGSFNGSLLAPNATINATYGAFNGQLIAKTVNGGGLEAHKNINGSNTYFKGTINTTTNPVPEPGTLALIGAGLPLIGMLRRRAKKA